jgi:Secretion system C-terminal sorting domain
LPGDFKWDQDFFPSDLEMAFGRIDFADLTDLNTPEMELIERYFDRLSGYRNVEEGFEMGQKSGFYSGYDNSNDGSFRSLPNISGPENVYQNYAGGNHNQWVRENGPFAIYMQNRNVPEISDWVQFGMDATVYSSDQSYWGFGDVPQGSGAYSRIRALLGVESKCLIALWTTTGINIFHQVCTGISVGLAMKEIMNHNEVNQYLEKPPQQYDDERWWNRTHFAFYGDPSLQLYQVKPVEWINLEASGSNAILFWSRSSVQGAGYQVYESDNELGPFERITTNSLSDTSFVIPNYSVGNWYMVKVTQSHTAGCGEIVNTSMGISLQADIDVGIQGTSINKIIQIHPNPAQSIAHLEFSEISNYISILSADGKLIEAYKNLNSKKVSIPVDHLKSGVYFIQIGFIGGSNQVEKLIITK